MIEEIEINEDFKRTLDLMENTNKNLLVTGKAGVGKSTLLQLFKDKSKKQVVVCAPTGLATINIGGQTIHSLFKLPPKFLEYTDIKKSYSGLYKIIDTIVIDEISMVRADLLDAIDLFMRLNGKDRMKPFGGAQVIFFGDLFQLPPVVENEIGLVINKIYKSPYFFDANVMKHIDMEVISLTKVYRQKDVNFIEFLDKVRLGKIDSETLELINKRVCENKPEDSSIIITPTNRVANFINNEELSKLPDKLHTYKAKIEGEFNVGNYNLPADLELNLKKGARVIFVKNDISGQWVNGSLGTITELTETLVRVKLDDETIVTTGAVDWDRIKYELDNFSKKIISKVTGTITQIPLRLAWALTIHKCQGQTLDKVHIDLSSGVWEFGHTYVALSRCRTLEGISLKSKICPNDIKVDNRVIEFLNKKLKHSAKTINDFIKEEKKNELPK